MPFEYNKSQLNAIVKKYKGVQERLQNLDPVLLRAGEAVLREARRRIQSGGDGSWPSNLAGNPLLRQEGTLARSLTLGGESNVKEIDGNTITVGTQLPYAKWLQEGTGIYGPSGKPITPKNARVLVFIINGVTYFCKSVKGSPPRPFLYFDDELRETIHRIAAKYFFGGKLPEVEE